MKDKLIDVLTKLSLFLNGNKYFTVIRNAFGTLLPVVLIGSFGSLFSSLISSPKTGLAQLLPWLENLDPAFKTLTFATVSFITILLVFIIGMNIGEMNKQNSFSTGIIALVSYILVVPNNIIAKTAEGIEAIGKGLPVSVLGAEGMLIGMIVAILSVEIFTFFMRFDLLKIKMPNSVPPFISSSFNSLVPTLITTVLVAVFGVVFQLLSGMYINEWVYSIIQAPMQVMMQSNFGIIFLILLSQVMWVFGMHGGQAIAAIRNPLFVAGLATNIELAAQGLAPTQPLTFGFWRVFAVLGGAGYVLSLVIAIFWVSKREDEKAIAKLGLVPAVFGISEPVVFGLPLVMNVTYMIPFILNSAIAAMIAMFAIQFGFLTPNVVDVPFGFPIFVNGFISYGWQGVIVQLVCLVFTTILWIPFVRLSNKQQIN